MADIHDVLLWDDIIDACKFIEKGSTSKVEGEGKGWKVYRVGTALRIDISEVSNAS